MMLSKAIKNNILDYAIFPNILKYIIFNNNTTDKYKKIFSFNKRIIKFINKILQN